MRHTFATLSTLLLAGLMAAPLSAQTFFETSFEASEATGASYSVGDLSGQGSYSSFGGWTVTGEGGATVASDSTPAAALGSNVGSQGANSTIRASVTSSARTVLLEAYHNAAGVDAADIQEPAPGTSAAVVLAFEATGEGTYTIKAFDGPSGSGQGFIAADGAADFSSDQFNKIVVRVDYDNKTYDIAVNNQPYLLDVNFFDPTVDNFNAFESSTKNGSLIDGIRALASTGDADNDGISDRREIEEGTNPLDENETILIGDVNNDGLQNLLDAVLIARGLQDQGTGDINNDGNVTLSDAEQLFDFVVGADDDGILAR